MDATAQEEASTPLRLLLVFSFPSSSPDIQAMRLLGSGELTLALVKDLVKVWFLHIQDSCLYMDHLMPLMQDGEKYARQIFSALNTKLKDEDVRRNQKARDRFAAHR